MNSEFSETELRQMRRMDELRHLTARTFLRFSPILLLVFVAAFFGAYHLLSVWSSRSPWRYSAETKLLYAPRQNNKLPPLGDKQVFGVLDRASLRRAVGDRIELPPAEKENLAGDIEFEQSPRPSNIFVINAHSSSESNAIAKANAFAAILVDEYVAYRRHDIEAWGDNLRRQKEEFEQQIAEMGPDESFAVASSSAAVAAQAISTFNNLANGNRRELGRLAMETAAGKARVEELEKSLGPGGQVVTQNAAQLIAMSDELAALDTDITKLRDRYTDRNPKVEGKLEDRAALEADYRALLEKCGLESVDRVEIERKVSVARELADAQVRLKALEAQKEALEQEIAKSEMETSAISEDKTPSGRSLARRNELEKAILGLEEQLNDARFFATTISADLRQIEPASDVSERTPGGQRDIAVATGGAIFLSLALGSLFVAIAARRRRGASAALALLLLLAGGCVGNRWNERAYDDLEELGTAEAVVDESRRDAEAERQRREILAQLDDDFKSVYRISPGDKIQISVYGEKEMNIETRIGPDGSIGMMFVGQLTVSGLTIAEARDQIEEKLARYVKHPVVGLAVLEVSSETVTVSGSADHPGLYTIAEGTRLADVYAMAGGSEARLFNGIVVDVADLENSILVRDGKRIPVDFRAAIERGDPLENIHVRKGDYIFIAQRMESSVTICGDVRNPHKRLYEAGMGLLEALSSAGWMLDSHWKWVIIIRDGLGDEPKMYKVDVDGVLAGSRRNVHLKPNDIVFVPRDELEGRQIMSHRYLPEDKINIPPDRLDRIP